MGGQGKTEATPQQLKDEGNQAYKDGNWDKALEKYTQCEDFNHTVKDCTECLELSPKDPKALFRRAQAYEGLEMFEKAYGDVRAAQAVDPKNKEVQHMLERIHKVVQDLIESKSKTSGKVQQLFEILFDPSHEKDKRETCANNLVALAKERAGADLLLSQGLIGRLVQLLKTERNLEIRVACARTFSEFSRDSDKAKMLLREVGIPWLLDLMNSPEVSLVNATQYTFQVILNTLTGMDIKLEKRPDKILLQEHQKEVDSLMATMVSMLTRSTMSGVCRDAIIELVLKNLPWERLDWGDKFIHMGGIEKLLDISSELPEFSFESCLEVTDNTRITTSICLSRMYESQSDDKARGGVRDRIDEYIRLRLLTPDREHQIRVVVVITTLLLGPLDLGNHLIAREGMLEMMLVMAGTDDTLQQKVACEALIAAASKKDKCKSITTQGTDILKKLYQSKDDSIRVRALVGLCKLGSVGGTDASLKPFGEGAALKLAEACRRFLVNPSKDKDMRRWACEGLSFLTLDAEVKEKLIADTDALHSMIELAKSGDMNCLYGVVATFVNLCNAYDKQEVIPEMIELAKFAKQHIPETHELDDQDFIDNRITILAQEGASGALSVLSKTESHNSRELIARTSSNILFSLRPQAVQCDVLHPDTRGLVVQQGGVKALLGLATDGTKQGKVTAAHALARIAITINPEVSFPGQRAYEVVRPFLKILHPDCTAIENFEALMGLTNIAGMSESARKRIIKEHGLSLIENYMFEHHDMIRRAAIQCMANMCASPDVIQIMEGQNDKVKYLTLCASDEDEEIVKAAAGALCMVLAESPVCLKKIFDAIDLSPPSFPEQVKDWQEILQFLLSSANKDIQYRGTVIVYLLACHDKNCAERVIDTHCKTALEAISKIDNPELVLPKAQEYAHNTLKVCANQWKLIKDPDAVED
ncbi:Protein unc-45 B [Chionoecetes opilio]|uniref:Protein unc-45 homolog B n=1 Tax=Chionoecetes opilio TaxID=41210 RepID=A0A8J4XLT7_CHIOP|nr:Protein unc-45 B [Chionoecetes opilio]